MNPCCQDYVNRTFFINKTPGRVWNGELERVAYPYCPLCGKELIHGGVFFKHAKRANTDEVPWEEKTAQEAIDGGLS